jgi:glycosyltransferase involved in cell wall biosynthesis
MISANVISGPFLEPFAEASFQSIQDLVDEIIVVDTAPGNNPNVEINKKYATSVLEFPGGGTKNFSFSAARELARVNSKYKWILKWDQDEVLYENDIDKIKSATLGTKKNGIELAFYHFMVYPWLYQFIDTKRFLFKRDEAKWEDDVHEGVYIRGDFERLHSVKVFHYGYLRGQEEVFKRWKFYAEIVDKPNWYDGQDPSNILTDRISVCQNFQGEHPAVVQPVLAEMFKDAPPFQIKEVPRYSMSDNHVGLLLITYNDAEYLPSMIRSLEETVDYPTHIQVIDMGSTDKTIDFLHQWVDKINTPLNFKIHSIDLSCWSKLESLTKTMNNGFMSLMSRQECGYIGWIHPDMLFEHGWLTELIATLQVHPEIGKICSFNTREGRPSTEEIFEGQEQAYIIRRGTLLQVGLFDESYIGIGGYEDWDMNNRIRREGLKVAITPNSLVWHQGMGTRGKSDTSFFEAYNRAVYKKKWEIFEETKGEL